MSWHVGDPDRNGQIAVVTGANSGLGWQTARGLAHAGMHVTLAVRRAEAGEVAAQRIRDERPRGTVRVGSIDLGNLESVAAFAAGWAGPIDLLVNNAGLMLIPTRKLTSDGFERQFGVNHLGHFALTAALWPALTDQARVVSVSSLAHRAVKRLDRSLSLDGDYSPMTAYGQSKLANLLFVAELARRTSGTQRTAVAAHPGWSATAEEPARGKEPLPVKISRTATAVLGTKPAHGARSQLQAALGADVRSDDFWGPRMMIGGRPHRCARSAGARNLEDAAWLWEESQRRTGVTFTL